MSEKKQHWETVFTTKAENEVSWYQNEPKTSIQLIQACKVLKDAKIIDMGGGDSYLIDSLLDLGYTNLFLLDISAAAIERAKKRLGEKAKKVTFIVSDSLHFQSDEKFDVWHDRAVFHFLTEEAQRVKYVAQVMRSVKHGGYVIMSTFGPEGPEECSGLEVVRYDTEKLHGQFGKSFRLIDSSTETHKTPMGTTQQFLYCFCRME